ncbi:hypothetical protein [Chamaesiphon sp. VAR_48_metabat_135_sub]|nr:hypothetical protein [Chamaesiphon sp. VAR_48_metabat_135_sub]
MSNVDERGEWEAWAFGAKILGADLDRSFGDMMQRIYQDIWSYVLEV